MALDLSYKSNNNNSSNNNTNSNNNSYNLYDNINKSNLNEEMMSFIENLPSYSGQDCYNSENKTNQEEPIIYTCDKCPFTLLINFFEQNSEVYIYYTCQNNAYYFHEANVEKLDKFFQNKCDKNKLIFKCCKCNSNNNINNNNNNKFYCCFCDKIYCEFHKKEHIKKEEKKDHVLLDINEINIKCVKHNEDLTFYDIKTKKNSCSDCCVNNESNYKKISEFDHIEISKYEKEINEKKNLLSKIKKYCEEVNNKLIMILNEFKNNCEIFFKNNNILMKLADDLIFNYKKCKQENHLTYESIKNIMNLVNFKQIEFNNIENLNIFEKINYFNEFSKNINFCIFKSSFDPSDVNQNNLNSKVIFDFFNNEKNINLNDYKIRKIKAHKKKISCLIILQDKRLCTTSDDETIKIFNPQNNFSNDITIKNLHNNVIYGIIQIKDGKLISFSLNRICLIELLEKKKYNCTHIMNIPNICQNSLVIELLDNRIATSLKNEILIIKIDNRKKMVINSKIQTDFENYLGFLYQIKNDEILVSSYYEKNERLQIYNINSEKKVDLKNCAKIRCIGWINSICKINDNLIGICAEKNSIKIFDIFNYCIVSEFIGESTFFSLVKNKNYFLAGNYNNILLLEFNNNKFTQNSELIKPFVDIKINSIVCFDDKICLSSNKNRLILLYIDK